MVHTATTSDADRGGLGRFALCAAIFSSLLAIGVMPSGPFAIAEEWLFDRYQQLWPPDRSTLHTVVVAIDDQSIQHIGQWPWPHDELAALIVAARGAAAIGVDVLLPDADRLSPERLITTRHVQDPEVRKALLELPEPDMTLADAISDRPVVLAIATNAGMSGHPLGIREVKERGDGIDAALIHSDGALWPLTILAGAAQGFGVVSTGRAPSGNVNAFPAAVEVDDTVVPGFSLELIRTARAADAITLSSNLGRLSAVSVGGVITPIDPSGRIRPRFIAPSRLEEISAESLLGGEVDLSMLQQKIVLMGVTAIGAGEIFRIPLAMQASAVEVQAELIESILSGDTLLRPFWAGPWEWILGAILSLSATLLLGRARYHVYLVALGIVAVLFVSGSVLAFLYYNLLLDWLFPLTCLFVTSFAALCLQVRNEGIARRRREAELRVAVAKRSAAERELALRIEADTLRDNLALAVDAAALGMWRADLHRCAWHHSKEYDEILGLAPAPKRWSPEIILQRVAPEDRAEAARGFAIGQETGNLQLACWIRHPNGSPRAIHVIGRFWKDEHGVPQRVAGVVVDITRQRELEQRLRESNTMQSVGLLAGGVAHNFNNLLTVMLGNLGIAEGVTDELSRLGRAVRSAAAAGNRAAEIVRHLLVYARKQTLSPREIDFKRQLIEVVEMLQDSLPANVQVELKLGADLGHVKIDPLELDMALLNLANNARDAMPAGGRLDISGFKKRVRDPRLGLDGEYLVVEVADTGEGIPSEDLPKIFEPFFTTKEVGKGTGLGLSQVHGFAKQSGGAIDIDSGPGEGTRARLYLPVAMAPSIEGTCGGLVRT